MVRQVESAGTPGWKGILAVAVAGGVLLWHLLACTESPMAFSPSGKDLAFVTMEPFDSESAGVAGHQNYRLMVLTGARKLRVVEETNQHMLSAPAYSPDGKHLAYLRIPLLTEPQAKARQEHARKKEKLWDELMSSLRQAPATAPASRPSPTWPGPDEVETEHLMLPPVDLFAELIKNATTRGHLAGVLVVRDAKTDAVVSTMPVRLPVEEKASETYLLLYMFLRPQYGREGKVIYLCTARGVMALAPGSKKQRLLGAPATVGCLSPDGRTMALAHERMLAFIRTDGQSATYRRWPKEEKISPLGLAWKDAQTLALLAERKKDKKRVHVLHLVKSDGTVVDSRPLRITLKGDEPGFVALALAPDQRHSVVCSGSEVLFLARDGKVLRHWKADNDKELMYNPTFAPDGKRVAFKHMREKDDKKRAGWIVYFTPEGKEITRVEIPLSKLATRPAGGPSQ